MKKTSKKSKFKISFSALVIPISFVIAYLVFEFIMGASDNFQGGNSENAALPGNYFGTIYKGGIIVPVLMTLLLILLY